MTRTALTTIALVLLLACAGTTGYAQKKRGPKGFVLSSREGKFSITLPSGFEKPEQSVEKSADDDGSTTTTTTYTAGNERGACLVSFTRYDDDVFDAVEPTALLDAARDGAIEEIGQGLDTQEDFMFGRHHARVVTFRSATDDGTSLYSRFVWIIAKPCLYQVAFVAVDPEDLDADDILTYFDSFTLTTTVAGKKKR